MLDSQSDRHIKRALEEVDADKGEELSQAGGAAKRERRELKDKLETKVPCFPH
jgi:hypothetical protein